MPDEGDALFVYGTLKEGFVNHPFLGDAEKVGVGRLKEEFLMVDQGCPVVYKDLPDDAQRGAVNGEVWIPTNTYWPYIDQLEGHPYLYRREKRSVILKDGSEVEAWVYLMSAPKRIALWGEHISNYER